MYLQETAIIRKIQDASVNLRDIEDGLYEYEMEEEKNTKRRRRSQVINDFLDFVEVGLSLCENYSLENDITIEEPTSYSIIESAEKILGRERVDYLKKLNQLRNRYIHDYHDRDLAIKSLLKVCSNDLGKMKELIAIFTEQYTNVTIITRSKLF